jgi:hypothetical protein
MEEPDSPDSIDDTAKEGFICPECSFSANSMEDLLVHFEGHINNRISIESSTAPTNKTNNDTKESDTIFERKEVLKGGERVAERLEEQTDCDWQEHAVNIEQEYKELQLTNEQLGICLAHMWQVLHTEISKREAGNEYNSSQVITISQAVAGVKQCRDVLLGRLEFWNCGLPSQCETLLATVDGPPAAYDDASEAVDFSHVTTSSEGVAEEGNTSSSIIDGSQKFKDGAVDTWKKKQVPNDDSIGEKSTNEKPASSGVTAMVKVKNTKKVFDAEVSRALVELLTGDIGRDADAAVAAGAAADADPEAERTQSSDCGSLRGLFTALDNQTGEAGDPALARTPASLTSPGRGGGQFKLDQSIRKQRGSALTKESAAALFGTGGVSTEHLAEDQTDNCSFICPECRFVVSVTGSSLATTPSKHLGVYLAGVFSFMVYTFSFAIVVVVFFCDGFCPFCVFWSTGDFCRPASTSL